MVEATDAPVVGMSALSISAPVLSPQTIAIPAWAPAAAPLKMDVPVLGLVLAVTDIVGTLESKGDDTVALVALLTVARESITRVVDVGSFSA